MADAFKGFSGHMTKDGGIEVKVPNIPLWVPSESAKLLNTLTRNAVHLALQEVSGRVSEEAGRFADTGHLAQSFANDPATGTGGIELIGGSESRAGDILGRVFSALPYAIVMEAGRRPGQPISRAGIDAIGLWAQRKLGLSADAARNAKWAIAQNIVAQGIEGKGYFEDGVRRAQPRVEQLFKILGDQIAAALTGQRQVGGGGQTGGVAGGVA